MTDETAHEGDPGAGRVLTAAETDEVVRHFEDFADTELRDASPVYFALVRHIAADVAAGGLHARLVAVAPPRQRVPNLLLAAVQRCLFDAPHDALAAYYPSLGGHRAPDDGLPAAFDAFVSAHGERIAGIVAVGETQTNEVRRAAPLFPAFGWAQACTRRPLGLIEVGTSAGLLLHADRYGYVYGFEDGTEMAAGADSADGVPLLRCPVRGGAVSGAATATTAATAGAAATAATAVKAAAALKPFVTKPLRIASRVGLDLNPLDPADPEACAWLRALIWPEHEERRARLDAALEHARRRPVRLRKGDAPAILPDAVASVGGDAIPCVFVSNSLPHWTPEGRTRFAALIRELGATRDLVCIVKEIHQGGLGLFTGRPDEHAVPGAPPYETIGAAVYLGGKERLFRLGAAGMHGSHLEWSPAPLG